MPWYVVYTKPKNEKKTAGLLAEKGVEVYCPVQSIVRQWSDRRKKIDEPLFKSYLFVFLDDYKAQNVAILTTPGVVRFLWWAGKPGVVRDQEMEELHSFLEMHKGRKLSIEFRRGEQISIAKGPLRGTNGKLVSISGKKAILELKLLGCLISAEVPVMSLETIH